MPTHSTVEEFSSIVYQLPFAVLFIFIRLIGVCFHADVLVTFFNVGETYCSLHEIKALHRKCHVHQLALIFPRPQSVAVQIFVLQVMNMQNAIYPELK